MVGIIILNYLTYNETINCVQSIKKTYKREKKICIVDNASPNHSYEYLKREFQDDNEIILVSNKINNGYAAGNNIGIRILKDKCKYIIISNSDVIFKENSINNILIPLFEGKSSCVAPKVLKTDGSEWYSNQFIPIGKKELILGYSFLKILDLKKTYRKVSGLDKNRNDMCYIYAPSGCCFSIRTKDFVDVGLFDERTFLGYEEAILGYKLRNEKKKVLYYPNAEIYHAHMASTKQIGGLSMVYCSESEMYYVKHYLKASKVFVLFLSIIRIIEFIRLIFKNSENIKWFKKYKGIFRFAIFNK